VRDAGGIGVGGIGVEFVPVLGSGFASPPIAPTDAAGTANAIWPLGPEAGAAQRLEARVSGLAPAVAAVEVAPLLCDAVGLEAAAAQNIQCAEDSKVYPIPEPACAAPLSELKLEIRGTAQHSAFGSATGTLRCANVEIPLDPLLGGASTAVTVVWREGAPAIVSVGGAIAGTATVTVHPDLAPGTVSLRAAACGADNFHYGRITVDELRMWGDGAYQPRRAPRLEIASGNGQAGATGTPLSAPLVVRVVDGSGDPLPGQTVEFVVVDGLGDVSPSRATSRADGTVAATWTLGWGGGPQTVLARVVEPSTGFTYSRVVFNATAEFEVGLEIASGDDQLGRTGAPLSAPLVVRVTDVLGNPAPGREVVFRVMDRSGGTVSPELTTSGPDGTVEATWTLGWVTGPQAAQAWSDEAGYAAGTVTFHATAEADYAGKCGRDLQGETVTLLATGSVLVVGGTDGCGPLSSSRTYDPLTDSWATAPAMAAPRSWHSATLLPSGDVLVAGGNDSGPYAPGATGTLATALLYRPGVGEWIAAGAMGTARWVHRATILLTGEVLVVGGVEDPPLSTPTAELFDPASGTWRATGSPVRSTGDFSMTLLDSGKVLAAGGDLADPDGVNRLIASAELYDPGTGTWTETGSMASPRRGHTATLLADGRVLVAGGDAGAFNAVSASAEVYDPVTGRWTVTGALSEPRWMSPAVLLPTGKVLAWGGFSAASSPLLTAELYDPGTGSWTLTGSQLASTSHGGAALLPTGRVLSFAATSEVYDPLTGAWTSAAPIPVVRDTLP
jgi:hypothetical protein